MGKTERSNGAYGKRDIEGKTAREAASELGKERVSNERERMSQCFRSLDASPRLPPSPGNSRAAKYFTRAAVDEANPEPNSVICRRFAAKDLLAKSPIRSVSG